MGLHVPLVHNRGKRRLAYGCLFFLQLQGVHEHPSFGDALHLEAFGSAGVQVAKFGEMGGGEAHNSVLLHVGVVTQSVKQSCFGMSGNVRAKVGAREEVEEQLVVAEDSVPRHQNSRLLALHFAFHAQARVVEAKRALHREVDLGHFLLGRDNFVATKRRLWKHSRVQSNDDFVDEASVARIEKVPKVLLELLKAHVDHEGLVFRSESLVKVELLHDQVVVVLEALLDRASDLQVKRRWNVVGPYIRVRHLQLLDPDVKLLNFRRLHRLEVNLRLHQRGNQAREQRKERQAAELEYDREN